MNRRKQTPIRFLALVMAIATITSFSLFATAQGVIIDNTYEQTNATAGRCGCS